MTRVEFCELQAQECRMAASNESLSMSQRLGAPTLFDLLDAEAEEESEEARDMKAADDDFRPTVESPSRWRSPTIPAIGRS